MKKLLIGILVLFCTYCQSFAQNIAITDDNGYTADPSAMLDVKATTKGVLVPRVTSPQRIAIAAPATGLLVFDSTEGSFFFYTGAEWINLSFGNPSNLWAKNGRNVFLVDTNDFVGVGTDNPVGKLEVKADGSIGPEEPIFEVINANGDTVFAVYPEGVRVYVSDNSAKAVGSKGGFAVGGFSNAKNTPQEYLRVTPDSVRIYIDDDFVQTKVSGSKGGFAVGGFSSAKTYTDNYLFVQDDSTRVWTDGEGGFEIRDLATNSSNYLDLTPENYFIGHNSGQDNISGLYNSFVGYQSGLSNTMGFGNTYLGYESGFSGTGLGVDYETSYNVFIGNRSGYGNILGKYNVFLGSGSGYNSQGDLNVFIGMESGSQNNASLNTFVGGWSGVDNTTGTRNCFIGAWAGNKNTTGSNNTYLGNGAGANTVGANNVFVGCNAGAYEYTASNRLFIENSTASSTSALIYGEFDNNYLRFNAKVGVNVAPNALYQFYSSTNIASGYGGFFFNDGNNTNRYGIKIQAGLDNGADVNYMIRCYDGDGTYEGGLVLFNGNLQLAQNSDFTLKENIHPTEVNGIEILKGLKVVDYSYIESGNFKHTGYIAQDAQKVFPKMIIEDEETGFYGMDMTRLIPVLNKAIQEQQEIIETLQSEINELKMKVNQSE